MITTNLTLDAMIEVPFALELRRLKLYTFAEVWAEKRESVDRCEMNTFPAKIILRVMKCRKPETLLSNRETIN